MNLNPINRGISILGVLFLGVIIILVISYFNISIKSVVEKPETKDNFSYVVGNSESIWDRYFKGPATYLWQDVWVDIFWKSFINSMERIRDGKPSELDKQSPTVSY
ncbi:MAG: hypothetical protein V4486_01365 [Patescibacteria group bacterium]